MLNTIHSTEYVDLITYGRYTNHYRYETHIPIHTGNAVLGRSVRVYARHALSDEWPAADWLRLSRRQ